MKIVDIETYVVGAGWKNWLFVRVLTDEGIYGVGEATLNGFALTCEAAVSELKTLVIGFDPREVRHNVKVLFDQVSNDGGEVHHAAVAGIEEACWDILGKSLGVPVYQLLGGKVRDWVDCYANGWYRAERSADSFASMAHKAVNQGFKALKLDPLGTSQGFLEPGDLELSREILKVVREAVGPKVRIMVDVHARLAESEAVALITSCSDLGIFWWEEPTTRQREAPTNSVGARVAERIASGESFSTVGQFLTLMQGGSVSIYQPEPMSLGGILPTIAVAELAAANGAWIAPHQSGGPIATVVCLQLAACLSNFLIQEHFDPFNEPWTKSLVTWTPQLDTETGRLEIPNGPGLGVDLNMDEIAAHPYDPKAFLDVTAEGWEQRLGKHSEPDLGIVEGVR